MELEIIDEYSKCKKTLPLIPKDYERDNVYEKEIFFENKKYALNIKLSGFDQIKDVNIYVGDIPIKGSYNYSEQMLKCSPDYIFIDCFDLVKVQVEIIYLDDIVEVVTTNYIRIAVPKATNQYVERMLHDIENNYPQILEVCFSKNKKQSGINENGERGIDSTFFLLDEVYKTFKEVYPFFQNSSNKRIDDRHGVIDGYDVNQVSPESVNWIFQHPETMKEIKSVSPIVLNGKYYQVQKINATQRYETNSTYENQVLLGFIDHVIKYLSDIKLGLEQQIKEYEKDIPSDLMSQLPVDYDLAYNCIVFYYKEIIRKTTQYLNIYNNLFDAYNHCFNCELKLVNSIPRYTFVFRQRFHYRRCFEMIVKWFEAGQYNLLTCDYLFKLKKLSRIFEYYTLLKLQEGIENNGGSLLKVDNIIYDKTEDILAINNYYKYVQKDNHSIKIEVYYEPYVYRDKIVNGIDLYSIGYKYLEKMRESKYWTPDFLIKVSIENMETYFIMDSKFSSFKTVKEHRMVDIINKYVLGIASMNQYHSRVLGLWGIYPSIDEKNMNLKKNNVNSMKEALPVIEIQSLEIERNSMTNLVNRIINVSRNYLGVQ